MSGGVFRALRHELNLPLAYPMDDRDYTVVTRTEAKWLGRLFQAAYLMVAATFNQFYGARLR